MVDRPPLRPLPRWAIRPELTDEDVRWLNAQMALTGPRPPVKYARALPPPPPWRVVSR